MSLLDFILNLVALLMWLNWRAVELSAAMRPSVLSLASALKRAEPRRAKRGHYLMGLAALLVLRSVFYWQAGPALNWTPHLTLGTISLPFHSDTFLKALAYSLLAFVETLGMFYLALILVAVVNRRVLDSDPVQHVVRLQLGGLSRLPWLTLAAMPVLTVAAAWFLLNKPFVRLGLTPQPGSVSILAQQSLFVGVGILVWWKYVVTFLLTAYTLNCYVYLGRSPVWNFFNVTGRNLLSPLRWLPLGIGKADFAPVVGVTLALVLAYYLENVLTQLYARPPL